MAIFSAHVATLDATRSRRLTFVFFGLVLLLAALWAARPLIHDDLFFHLATGKYVVEQHQVPTTDPFSFTRQGERWVSHERGFGVVAYLVWLAGGYGALVALKVCLVLAILVVVLGLMQFRARSHLAAPTPGHVALLAIGLWAVGDQLILRASLFSSLFILLLLSLLYWLDRSGSRVAFATIALLFLLWGNFHGEVLFGLFVLGVFTAEGLLARLRHVVPVPSSLLQASPARPYLRLWLISFLLTLLNPNGIQVLLYPFRLAWFLSTRSETLEMGHFSGATPQAAAGFFVLLALLLLSMLPLERLRFLSLTEVTCVTAFLFLALRSHRFIVYFTLFALPVIARLLAQESAERFYALRSPRLRRLALGLVFLGVVLATGEAWSQRQPRAVSRHFPAGAVTLLQQEDVSGRLFNHQNYGGFLHWSLQRPIFWDGRNLLFASLMQEVATTPLEQLVDTWDLEYLVLTEFEFSRMGEQIDPGRWGLVYWDDFTAVYLQRGDRFDPLLERLELLQFPPFGGVEGLNLLADDDVWVGEARAELARILTLEPGCQRALYLQGLISFYRDEPQRAEAELERALTIAPNEHVSRALERARQRRPLT